MPDQVIKPKTQLDKNRESLTTRLGKLLRPEKYGDFDAAAINQLVVSANQKALLYAVETFASEFEIAKRKLGNKLDPAVKRIESAAGANRDQIRLATHQIDAFLGDDT